LRRLQTKLVGPLYNRKRTDKTASNEVAECAAVYMAKTPAHLVSPFTTRRRGAEYARGLHPSADFEHISSAPLFFLKKHRPITIP